MTKEQREALNLEKGTADWVPVDTSDPSDHLEDQSRHDERRMEDDIARRLEGELVDGHGANRNTETGR